MSLITFAEALFTRGSSRSADFVFSKPLSLTLRASERWAVIGTSKTDFLKAVSGGFLVSPPRAKHLNWAKLGDPNGAFEHLHFRDKNTAGSGFTHMSARYEFFKDVEVDERLENFISRVPYPRTDSMDWEKLDFLLEKLRLEHLKGKFVNALSNGQFRRAKIARSAYVDPRVWLLDDVFLGLDPSATETVSSFLADYTKKRPESLLILGQRVQDEIPDWITNIALVDKSGLIKAGTRNDLIDEAVEIREQHHRNQQLLKKESSKFQPLVKPPSSPQDSVTLIKFDNVSVKYGEKSVLNKLKWEVKDGEKWHIKGKNGSGKTTMLALITLDHPQSWNLSIEFLGIPRATGSTNFFKTNKVIGITSPELHSIFPQSFTLYDTLASGFSEGFIRVPADQTPEMKSQIEAYLKHFGLWDKRDQLFRDFSISDQKLALFLRAIVKQPKVLILDEALSAMDDDTISKCKGLMENWSHGCVLCVGHISEEVLPCDKYIELINAPEGVFEIGSTSKQ
ncbi:unnamed protein product [Kuraishia capsulata CBS 1993]|uniref:ABC transporter domain-containing protein n=1 Tax=Kuraishia capsulata CBS 1993 TaxID=1382522 RepID=W6MXN2_9ASCO|nr:uncharacterized protein KUCA_T00005172001 [Kuraishia capsulata CBS 1993]CDK29185.1 unnamed protein product [Kuraishia capsulata CBS 1993]